jgi:hypothetical protein
MFTDFLIKQNKKLDQWTKEAFYDEYLFDYLRKEHPNDALERSFSEMQRWADETDKQFNNIFRECSLNKLCQMITNGRISPWLIFNCDSGITSLASMSTEQVDMVIKYIDPDYWQRRFKDYVADTELIKEVLTEAQV